jgi:hypothetical protein
VAFDAESVRSLGPVWVAGSGAENQQMAGYSSTPLVKKLGIQPEFRISVIHCPCPYAELVANLPPSVELVKRLGSNLDFVHCFVTIRSDLADSLPRMLKALRPDGMIWISWPKKASKVPTDITEDVIRDLALPLGLVDTKVCAVSEVWSGLRLVIRRELRRQRD